jgi:hypothetical protein
MLGRKPGLRPLSVLEQASRVLLLHLDADEKVILD